MSASGGDQLVITGTGQGDVIRIADDGTARPGNVTVTRADGTTYTSQNAVTQIEVLGKGGNDQVTYTLTGDLTTSRAVLTDLGAGNDGFTATLGGAVNNASGLTVEAFGDAGADTLAVHQSGAVARGTFFPYLDGGAGNDTLTYDSTGAVNAGASVSPGLSGGAGNDTISSTYAGVIAGNYIYNLAIDGGSGNDRITENVSAQAGSTGTVGQSAATPAVVEGGAGNDQITFAVAVDPAAAATQVNAFAVGGAGRDTVTRSANVQGDRSNESGGVLS
jgi:Ca2+-binding RTX toxin-like protein